MGIEDSATIGNSVVDVFMGVGNSVMLWCCRDSEDV